MSGEVPLDLHLREAVVRHQLREGRTLPLADLEEHRAARLQDVQRVAEVAVVEVQPRRAAVEREARLVVPYARIERVAHRALDVRRIRHDDVHALRLVEVVQPVRNGELHLSGQSAPLGVLLRERYGVLRDVRPEERRLAPVLLRERQDYRARSGPYVDNEGNVAARPPAGRKERQHARDELLGLGARNERAAVAL